MAVERAISRGSRRGSMNRNCRTHGSSTSHRARASFSGTIQTLKKLPGSPTPKVAPAGGRLGDSVCVHVFRGHRVRVCACEPSRQGVDSKTQCSAQMRLLHLNASGYRVSARRAGARAQGVSTRQVTLRSTSR